MDEQIERSEPFGGGVVVSNAVGAVGKDRYVVVPVKKIERRFPQDYENCVTEFDRLGEDEKERPEVLLWREQEAIVAHGMAETVLPEASLELRVELQEPHHTEDSQPRVPESQGLAQRVGLPISHPAAAQENDGKVHGVGVQSERPVVLQPPPHLFIVEPLLDNVNLAY